MLPECDGSISRWFQNVLTGHVLSFLNFYKLQFLLRPVRPTIIHMYAVRFCCCLFPRLYFVCSLTPPQLLTFIWKAELLWLSYLYYTSASPHSRHLQRYPSYTIVSSCLYPLDLPDSDLVVHWTKQLGYSNLTLHWPISWFLLRCFVWNREFLETCIKLHYMLQRITLLKWIRRSSWPLQMDV